MLDKISVGFLPSGKVRTWFCTSRKVRIWSAYLGKLENSVRKSGLIVIIIVDFESLLGAT